MAEERKKRLALVASKGSLDMAYPPFILATTAASMGWDTAIFFTFYGLDIIHKKKLGSLKVAPVGNPAMPAPFQSIPIQVPNIVGVIPGATALATAFMKRGVGRQPVRLCYDHGDNGGGRGGSHRRGQAAGGYGLSRFRVGGRCLAICIAPLRKQRS